MKNYLASFVNTPPSDLSHQLFQILNVEPGENLKVTLIELEYGDRQWSFNLCRAIEYAWHLGTQGRNIKQDLTAILSYLTWESEDFDAGLVDRSEAELKLIWETIALLYLRISALR